MTDPVDPTPFSLRRWSRRKHEAARKSAEALQEAPATEQPASVPAAAAVAEPAAGVGAPPALAEPPANAAAPRPDEQPMTPALPPIESLTIESDFTPFMQPGVDESVKRSALRKLFRDPRFNVMDGLDVYIDDYSKPDPIDPAIVRTLAQARYIFSPPKTRVNEHGYVEDVPDVPPEAEGDAAVDAPEAAALEQPVAAPMPLADGTAAVEAQVDAQAVPSGCATQDERGRKSP